MIRFLAEESGRTTAHCRCTPDAPASRAAIWIIDPLDGTVNYANGIPCFCVSIGLAIGGRPMIGVVYDPTTRRDVHRAAGMGAKLDGMPIQPPGQGEAARLRRVAVAAAARLGDARPRRSAAQFACRATWAAPRWPLAYLANGRFDAFVQAGGLSLWDICAAGLIAVEGGVRLTSLDGSPWFDIEPPTRSRSRCWARPRAPPDAARDARLIGWRPYADIHGWDHTVTGHVLVWPELHSAGLGSQQRDHRLPAAVARARWPGLD